MQQIRKRQKTANKADNDQAKPKLKKVRQQDRDEEGHASGYTVLSLLAILILFLIARGLAAWLNIINDCDESMNYWEPAHYLMYGYGLQTWEYSPQYALRSYYYLWHYIPVAKLVSFLTANKMLVFYAVRAFLAVVSATTDTALVAATKRFFGNTVANFLCLFLLFSPGMFISTTNFLPSSFAMMSLSMSLTFWIRKQWTLAVMFVACAAIIGWPFSALVGAPLALHLLIEAGIVKLISSAVLSLVLFMGPSIVVDYFYYQKPVIAMWNILTYNVFNANTGPDLYGVEPWYYYLLNGFLNFNIVLGLALLSVPVVLLYVVSLIQPKKPLKEWTQTVLYLSCFYIWFGFMSAIPHKEERFLFVVYPHICFAAAIAMYYILGLMRGISASILRASKSKESVLGSLFAAVVVVVVVLLSLSRTSSIVINYRAPIQLFGELYEKELTEHISEKHFPGVAQVNVCIGKEWYRFPTHYFLHEKYRLRFVKSSFGGQLPQYFHPNGTSFNAPHFNDLNKEEPTRYVALDECHYFVDVEFEGQLEPQLSSLPNWEIVFKYDFMNADRSHRLYRAFYVPYLSKPHLTYDPYVLLKNNKPKAK
jgi:alpha-1,2-mannosyltransferase